jgi:hypothetical protein
MVLNKNIKLSTLQFLLVKKYGTSWLSLEPETIMMDLGFPDYLVLEKIHILTVLNKGLNEALKLADFLTWASSICNNDYAEFEIVQMPNCLELAWLLTEVKRIGKLINQAFVPSEELIDTLAYLLRMEGFSAPICPFEFIPTSKLEQGQTEEDTELKKRGVNAYLVFMDKIPAVIE